MVLSNHKGLQVITIPKKGRHQLEKLKKARELKSKVVISYGKRGDSSVSKIFILIKM